MIDRSENRNSGNPSDAASSRIIALCLIVLIILAVSPTFILAQSPSAGSPPSTPTEETGDLSGSESEDAVRPSGMEPENAVQPSGMEGEASGIFTGLTDDPFQLSPGEDESITGDEMGPPLPPGFVPLEPLGPPPRESDDEEFMLPEIEVPDFGERVDRGPSDTGQSIFSRRPSDEFYQGVVTGAARPDISLLGPLPEMIEEGVEFTDVAADWIYHQKSVGLTELRGHVMVIYDTTIISCDEAILDEKNEIYHFFGEGRTFVDDADFTLECDELEIHDAEGEKMVYISGSSTMVVFVDEDAEEPGEDSTRRERLEYALSRQDTTITFTDAEYDYENDIFDAHGGVRFEQEDKYAQGDEFHGEGETDYMLFTGDCEFWQADGHWLYEHRLIEDEEDPPSKGDRLTRALMSVPSTITCDEAEAKGEEGWLQLRTNSGNIVYFHQDDKHAECETFTLWYSEEEEGDGDGATGEPDEIPEPQIPPGFGTLRLASEFPSDYTPWETSSTPTVELPDGAEEDEPLEEFADLPVESVESVEESEATEEVIVEDDIVEEEESGDEFEFEFPSGETTEPGGTIGSLAELGELAEEYTAMADELTEEDLEGPRNEILLEGNVFFRQENGDWLFEYDVIREEEESEEDIEQYRRWANGSCDTLHVWMDDEKVEALGSIFGEQDNQDLAAEFLRYVAEMDMLYLRGNIVVHREGKHQIMANEGFLFFSTNVFEALGSVRTTVTVDVEELREEAQEIEEEVEEES